MKWASVYSLRPDWNFAKICHLIFDKLDAKLINLLLSLYFDELYLFSKTTLFFKQLTKKSPVFSQGSSSFYFNVNHHRPAPSKRSKAEAPLFSCVDARKFGGPNPGAVIYGRLDTTWARQVIWAKKHINNEMKKAPYRAWQGQSRGFGKTLPQI